MDKRNYFDLLKSSDGANKDNQETDFSNLIDECRESAKKEIDEGIDYGDYSAVDEQGEEKLTASLVMDIAGSLSGEQGEKVRISAITREVQRSTGVDSEKVSKFVRKILARQGWDVSPMESKVDEDVKSDLIDIGKSKLGWAVAEQLKDDPTVDGIESAELNSNAVRMIYQFLKPRPEEEAKEATEAIEEWVEEGYGDPDVLESKVDEQEFPEEELERPEKPRRAEPKEEPDPDAPPAPPEEVKEEPRPMEMRKEYLGKTDDTHFYFLTVEGDTGEVDDFVITDQEGVKKYSAKEQNIEVTGESTAEFLINAIRDIDIMQIERSIFMKYIYPELIKEGPEEEIIEEPEEESEEELEKKPLGPEEEEEELTKESKVEEKKPIPTCPKCGKKHWPFQKCKDVKEVDEQEEAEPRYPGDVWKLETAEEDSAITSLGFICEEALEGDVEQQKLLEEIFEEKWEYIKSKLETEGSAHYVWWMDGVHKFVKMHEGEFNEMKENAANWREVVDKAKLYKMKVEDEESSGSKKEVEENYLIEMKVTDDGGNAFDVYLIDDGTLDTVITISGKEFRFSPEFASMWRSEEGDLSEEGLRELALDALSNLEQEEYDELIGMAAAEKIEKENAAEKESTGDESPESYIEGKDQLGVRDGSGPPGGGIGRRKQADEECPYESEETNEVESSVKDIEAELDILDQMSVKELMDEVGEGSKTMPEKDDLIDAVMYRKFGDEYKSYVKRQVGLEKKTNKDKVEEQHLDVSRVEDDELVAKYKEYQEVINSGRSDAWLETAVADMAEEIKKRGLDIEELKNENKDKGDSNMNEKKSPESLVKDAEKYEAAAKKARKDAADLVKDEKARAKDAKKVEDEKAKKKAKTDEGKNPKATDSPEKKIRKLAEDEVKGSTLADLQQQLNKEDGTKKVYVFDFDSSNYYYVDSVTDEEGVVLIYVELTDRPEELEEKKLVEGEDKVNETDVAKGVKALIKLTKEALAAGEYNKAAEWCQKLAEVENVVPSEAEREADKVEFDKDEKPEDKEAEVPTEGKDQPGVRDGTGPAEGSFQRKTKGDLGKRKEAGEECPNENKDKKSKIQVENSMDITERKSMERLHGLSDHLIS